jgi:hypothetical protein
MDKHYIRSNTNCRPALEEKHINAEKVNKKTKLKRGNKNHDN